MKASELRIGNLVNVEMHIPIKVKVEAVTGTSVSVTGIEKNRYTPFLLDRIKPIPLTEEWLIKFGFVKENDWVGFISTKYRIGIRFYKGNSHECDIIQDEKFIAFGSGHIKHVHQLQNLYFALTNEELTIKQ